MLKGVLVYIYFTVFCGKAVASNDEFMKALQILSSSFPDFTTSVFIQIQWAHQMVPLKSKHWRETKHCLQTLNKYTISRCHITLFPAIYCSVLRHDLKYNKRGIICHLFPLWNQTVFILNVNMLFIIIFEIFCIAYVQGLCNLSK